MNIIDLLYDDASLAKDILKKEKPVLTKEEYLAKMESYFKS